MCSDAVGVVIADMASGCVLSTMVVGVPGMVAWPSGLAPSPISKGGRDQPCARKSTDVHRPRHLAAAVRPQQEEIHDVAGSLRAQIETAVRRARPHWAEQDLPGQEVGAFADFLTWGLQAVPLPRNRAVAVYDSRTGGCEVYRPWGCNAATTRVTALWFSGAHYRWVSWREPGPTLAQLLSAHGQPGAGLTRVITVTITAAGPAPVR